MGENRVVVTGLGVISPVGNDVSSFWQAIESGKSGAGKVTYFDASKFDSQIDAEVKDFDPIRYGMTAKDAKRMETFVQFAVAATKQAVVDSGIILEKTDLNKAGVLIGSGIGGLHRMEEEHGHSRVRGGFSKSVRGCVIAAVVFAIAVGGFVYWMYRFTRKVPFPVRRTEENEVVFAITFL